MKKISLILVALFFAATMFVACGGGETTDNHDTDTEETTTDETTTEDVVAIDGKAIYEGNCVACHGADGKGVATFPSLVDGDKKEDIISITTNGNPEKGMTAYKDVLSAGEISAVTDYILGL